MRLRYIHTFIAGTIALASAALAQSPSQSSASVALHSEEVEESGRDYNLRVAAKAPVPDRTHEGFDIVEFTITNVGTDTSDVTKLAVSTIEISATKRAKEAHLTSRMAVPRIAPREQLTLRVQVPRLAGTSVCYRGVIEMPEEDTPQVPGA